MNKFLEFLKLTGIQVFFLVLISLFNLFTPLELINKLGKIHFQSYVLVFSGLIFLVIFFKNVDFRDIKYFVSMKSLVSSIVMALLLWNACVFIVGLGNNLNIPQNQEFSLSTILLTVFFVPIIEEYVCRIILINRFISFLNPLVLIISSAAFFSILHIRDINLWISSLVYGIVLASFYLATKNIFFLILTHVLYNSVYIILNSALINFNQVIFPYYLSTWHHITVIVSLLFFAHYFYRNQLWKKQDFGHTIVR